MAEAVLPGYPMGFGLFHLTDSFGIEYEQGAKAYRRRGGQRNGKSILEISGREGRSPVAAGRA